MCFSQPAERSLPVFRHADNAVFFGNYHRCAHHLLESIDFAQEARLPSLRLRLNFSRHELVVHKPPTTVLAPRNITHGGPTAEPRLLASCQAGSSVTAVRGGASQLTTDTPPTLAHIQHFL